MSKHQTIAAGAFYEEEPPPPWEPVELPPPAPAVPLGDASPAVAVQFERISALESLPVRERALELKKAALAAALQEAAAASKAAARAAGTTGLAPAGSADKIIKLNRAVKAARFEVRIAYDAVQRLKDIIGAQ